MLTNKRFAVSRKFTAGRLFATMAAMLVCFGLQAQNTAHNDSLNNLSVLAAEKSLREAVLKNEKGELVSTQWGSAIPSSPYIPASSENIKNAESALRAARIKGGGVPEKPDPPQLMNDFTGILTQEQKEDLTQRLEDFAIKTSNQVAVVIMPCLYGIHRADMAYKIGSAWGVGQAKFNNGVVFLVKPKIMDETGEVFIAVGKGLEPVLTDAVTNRIVHLRVIPAFKQNDYYHGISDALNIIFPIANGEISTDEFAPKQKNIVKEVAIAFIVFLLIVFILALYLSRKGFVIHNFGNSGGSYGSNWNSGSSRSRSSGRSGGGFGGFGGGGFSGGGAGGSW